MRRLFLFPVLLLCLSALAQKPITTFYNSPSIASPKGYSHAAIIDLGTSKMIIVSGQVALDSLGNLVGKDDMGMQTQQVFKNIKSIIEPLGARMSDIVKLNYFVKDVSKVQAIRDARDQFINTKNPPTSTLVQVEKLFREELLIEVEATIVIPKP